MKESLTDLQKALKAKRDKAYLQRKKAKDPVLFNKKANERVRRYQTKDPERTRRRSREYARRHPDQMRAYAVRYRPLYYAKNRIRILAKTKAYRLAHPEMQRRSRDKWNKNNREKLQAIWISQGAKRRGAKVQDPLVSKLIQSWRKQKSFTCYYCQGEFETKFLHVDHIVAITKGGKHEVGNVCKSCRPCNQSKSAKPIQDHVVNGQKFLL